MLFRSKAAQDAATKKGNDILAYVKSHGVDEKDVQTTGYSIDPQYSYSAQVCSSASSYCPPGKQVLDGYQVSETLTVKVRDTGKAGDLLAGVGSRGASSVSGLTFSVDDESAVQDQARDKAIADAKEKAEKLASSLGVEIVRVVGFSENGSNPRPMVYAMKASMGDVAVSNAAPEIATGQNKFTSDVSITYEIR